MSAIIHSRMNTTAPAPFLLFFFSLSLFLQRKLLRLVWCPPPPVSITAIVHKEKGKKKLARKTKTPPCLRCVEDVRRQNARLPYAAPIMKRNYMIIPTCPPRGREAIGLSVPTWELVHVPKVFNTAFSFHFMPAWIYA